MKNKFLYLLTFVSGMTLMVVEMSASRLLAPYFGASIFVWSSLIGSVMLFLSLGYFVGGKIADKYPNVKILYYITLTAGIFIALVPFLAKPILGFSLNTFQSDSYLILIASVISALLLISIPVTLLAVVSPYVMRILIDSFNEEKDMCNTEKNIGNISGKIFTVSTLGSLLGTFLPVIFFIPNFGTQKTFIFFSFILTAISAIGLFLNTKKKSNLLIIIIIFLLFFIKEGKIKDIEGSIYEGESIYNFIHVIETKDGTRELRLEEGYGIHSRYNSNQKLFNDVWSYYLFSSYFSNFESTNKVDERALIVGLGCGTISKIYNTYFPDTVIDGVELDPSVVEAGKEYFDLENDKLNIFIDDGRLFLRKTSNSYDYIMLDAYRLPYIPFHLATQEFFMEINEKLKPNGVFVVNIGRTIDDYRLVDAICKTLKTVYPKVFVFDIPGYSMNTLAFALKKEINIEDLKKNILSKNNPDFLMLNNNFVKGIKEYNNNSNMPIITDDCAPVEKIIDKIVIDYMIKQFSDW